MALKLKSADSGAGFYESFTDIIFATMAIFVLLMTIFLVLANETSPVGKAKKQLAAIVAETEQLAEATEEIEEQSEALEQEISELAVRSVEIAIVVDKTGSMEQELANLKSAIARLGALLPSITESVRIGVVAYRINENGSNATSVYPMTTISKRDEDQGRSVQSLNRFLQQQRHVSGLAPVGQATRAALSMFDSSPNYKGHQVFMLLGDVGPYEDSMAAVDRISNAGRAKAREMTERISQWVTGKKNRNIIVLFSGRDEIYRREFGRERQEKHRVSMELFKQIAAASGQPKAYTENQSTMLADFLVAALKRK